MRGPAVASRPRPRHLQPAAFPRGRGGGENRRRRARRGAADPAKEAAAAKAQPQPTSGRARVLVVDDESAIRLVCRVNLRAAGFDTIEAEDAETALTVARRERPDLILLDVMLPDGDGWEVAERLRADPETRDIAVVFLSARADDTDRERGFRAGALGYVGKPFEPLTLTQTIGDILERVRRGEQDALRREEASRLGLELDD